MTDIIPAPPAPMPDEHCVLVELVLGEVKTKTGEGQRGPWTRYYTKADDGEFYSTFDQKTGAAMTALALAGDPVLLTYRMKNGPKGPTREVVAVSSASPDDVGDADSYRKALKEIPF